MMLPRRGTSCWFTISDGHHVSSNYAVAPVVICLKGSPRNCPSAVISVNTLGFDGLRVRKFDDADRKVFEFRDAGGPQTTRSGYDFVFAFLQLAHQQARENSIRF